VAMVNFIESNLSCVPIRLSISFPLFVCVYVYQLSARCWRSTYCFY